MLDFITRFNYDDLVELTINIYGNLYLLIMIFTLAISTVQDKNHNLIKKISIPYTDEILIFYILIFLYNFTDILLIFFENSDRHPIFVAERIMVFIYYVIGGMLTLLLLDFVRKYVVDKVDYPPALIIVQILRLLQIACFVMLVISQFNGFIYYYDENGQYIHGFGFWIWQSVTVIIFLFIGITIFVNRKIVDPFLENILRIVIIIPLVAFVVSMIIPEANFTNTFVIIASLLVYLLYENYKTLYAVENVVEMESAQRKLMMDQIKPHFLHNSLNSIIYYIDRDPDKAKESLVNFSKYLRVNLNSVNTEGLIPFTQELEHTKIYLSLEKLRFEDNLNIEYDINDDDFFVPALSIQPMVENAVKHGIHKSDSGSGTVKIFTEETPECHVIKVIDNGAGFDTETLKTMDDTHIGVKNVMRRLEMECSGKLEFDSKPGEGTVCIISIPKQ